MASRSKINIGLLKQICAEFGGTFLYLCIAPLAGTNVGSNVTTQALANGLIVASIIQIIGHVSGGHINPAITLGFLFSGHINIVKAALYMIVQTLGSALGALAAFCLTVQPYRGDLGATVPNGSLNIGQVLFMELILTFLLVAVIINVTEIRRGSGAPSLVVGLCLTGCQCAALPYTASLNPVRSFGPALIMNIWTLHWAYWLGPMLGGAIAGLLYRLFYTTSNG